MTVMKVELSLYAFQLKNVAGVFRGTSDPFAVVTKLATSPGSSPIVLGKTEVIPNTLSPRWVKTFHTEYELGTPVKLAINIFDNSGDYHQKGGEENNKKPMGSAVFEIGELLGARGNIKAKILAKGGTLFATARKSQGSGLLRLEMKGIKLKNIEGFFGKSDPFYELSKKVDTGGYLTWDNVYRSEVKMNDLNPEWETAVVPLDVLCNGDLDCGVQVVIFDHERNGKHKVMSKFETSVNGLRRAAQMGVAIKLQDMKGKDAGIVVITKADVAADESPALPYPLTANRSQPSESSPARQIAPTSVVAADVSATTSAFPKASFIDYISGGCELNVVVAIDFTGSNGDPRQPGTLHYFGAGGGQQNDYEKAITSIVNILAPFDSDQRFPVWGFGAKYNGIVNHCFPCGPTQEAQGTAGVLAAYHAVFKSGLIMAAPTVFTEVIARAALRARKSLEEALQQGRQSYTILLIVTDGAVSDPRATAECIENLSSSPLSIVIVGVGTADFSAMQQVDDGARKRDIVQFVEFNRYAHSSVSLTSETLKEIPDQLTSYFASRGIAPLPPIIVRPEDSKISVEPEEDEIYLSLDTRDGNEIRVTAGGRDDDDFVFGFGK